MKASPCLWILWAMGFGAASTLLSFFGLIAPHRSRQACQGGGFKKFFAQIIKRKNFGVPLTGADGCDTMGKPKRDWAVPSVCNLFGFRTPADIPRNVVKQGCLVYENFAAPARAGTNARNDTLNCELADGMFR